MGRALVLLVALAACPSRKDDASKQPVEPKPAAVMVPVPADPPFEIAAPSDKLVSIGRGKRHACAVRASGAVDCWGQHRTCEGESCERHRRMAAPDATVRRVPAMSDAVAISADARCLLRKTGGVACLANDKLVFVDVKELRDVKAIANGGNCFIVGAGALECFDSDQKLWTVPNVNDAVSVTSSFMMACVMRRSGQIACGSIVDHRPFTTLTGVPRAKYVALGGYIQTWACVVAEADGATSCFEMSSYLEPGEKLQPSRNDEGKPDIRVVAKARGATQISIVAGDYTVDMEAVVDGRVWQTDVSRNETTLQVPILADTAQHVHGCAIRAQGSLVCWGANLGGVLAQTTTIDMRDTPPSLVVGVGDVVDLAVGMRQAYALTRSGKLLSWGGGARHWGPGQSRALPVSLGAGPEDLVEITVDRYNRLCARTKAGDVWCYIEIEHANDRHIAQLDTSNAASIAAGEGLVFVVRRDGGAEVHVTDPIVGAASSDNVELDAPVIGSSGHRDFRCWMQRDHKIGCPKTLDGTADATAMAAGYDFVCAIVHGEVRCWSGAFDSYGIRRPLQPVGAIAGIRDATDIAASRDYACAVHAGGRVACFHFDKDGKPTALVEVMDGGAVDVELGHGTADQIEASFQMHGPIAAGETGCAITRDYTVKCWGTNLVGETGDGSLIEATTPIGVKL